MTKARDIASAIPAPSTVSSAELGYLDGVTSAIQTQLDAKTAKSTLTTTGDIYYASAANTPARLAIGSTSNVLTVAGGVPTWAAPAGGGGMTLLSTHSLSGTTSTISSISTSYVKLIAYVFGITNSSTNADLYVNPNGSSTESDSLYNNTNNGWARDSNAAIPIATGPSGQGLVFNNSDNAFTCVFDNYSSTSGFKSWVTYGGGSDTSGKRGYLNSGIYRNTSAITSLGFRYSGYTMNGGTVLLYGVK